MRKEKEMMDGSQIQILKNIAYHNTMMLQCQITMEAMKAENKQRELEGKSLAYTEKQFIDLINEFGIHHNAVLSRIQESL